jgi:hypothetical protein
MFIHRPTRRFRKSVAGTTLAAATLGMAALITAGTAGAGSVDDAFIAQLDNDGITPPSVAVAETTGLSVKGAKVFALDAAQAYCPQYVTSS